MKLIFWFLVICLISDFVTLKKIGKTDSINKNKPKSNKTSQLSKAINVNSIDELNTLVNSNKYVLVFGKRTVLDANKLKKTLDSILQFRLNLTICIFNAQNIPQNELLSINYKSFPSIDLVISGYKKNYGGVFKANNLKIWIDEILTTEVTKRSSIEEIDKIDQHYFVYADSDILDANLEKLTILAKMISPLRIYTGFQKEVFQNSLSSKIATVRKYKNEVKSIDLNLQIGQLAIQIINDEFPKIMDCDDDSLNMIIDFKIPILVYFEDEAKDQEKWQIVKNAVETRFEYLLLMRVEFKNEDKCSTFLKNFLNVEKAPSLKILNMLDEVKRFNFIGSFDKEHVEFFLSNYISGNLKSYKLNQKLEEGENVFGVPLANYSIYFNSRKDFSNRFVFYVYDSFTPTLEQDCHEINIVRKKMRDVKNFMFFAIDHSKNDLDGFYNNSLPFVFLVLKNGKYVVYEKEKIDQAGLHVFILASVPEIQNKQKVEEDL